MDQCSEPENAEFLPRESYKEFLELPILGSTIQRKKEYTGADSHARWMSIVQGNLHLQAYLVATSPGTKTQVGEGDILHPVLRMNNINFIKASKTTILKFRKFSQ